MGLGDHRLAPSTLPHYETPLPPATVVPHVLLGLEFTILSHHKPEVITTALSFGSLEHALPISPNTCLRVCAHAHHTHTHTPAASTVSWRRLSHLRVSEHDAGLLTPDGRMTWAAAPTLLQWMARLRRREVTLCPNPSLQLELCSLPTSFHSCS